MRRSIAAKVASILLYFNEKKSLQIIILENMVGVFTTERRGDHFSMNRRSLLSFLDFECGLHICLITPGMMAEIAFSDFEITRVR